MDRAISRAHTRSLVAVGALMAVSSDKQTVWGKQAFWLVWFWKVDEPQDEQARLDVRVGCLDT
jgi:hypothetical protein